MNKKIAIFYSTGGFIGYVPFAPGTFGTITGIILFLLTTLLTVKIQLLLFFLCLLNAFPATKAALLHFEKSDPPQVVIDEVLGIWLTLILFEVNFKNLFLGFLFFRLFDIIKPFPVGYIDKNIKGEWGVICDDLAAGLMAKGLIWVLGYRL